MEQKETKQTTMDEKVEQPTQNPETANEQTNAGNTADQKEEAAPADPLEELQKKYDALHNDYLRLMADFENFRKRTLKEKQDLLKYGAEDALKKLLPVIDDFERAQASIGSSEDLDAVKEGVDLIYKKFVAYLDQNKVTAIAAAQGDAFDETLHDAMTMFPAPTPELKGKVIDCVTKGYKLDDKVLRYAKVVVGQ